MSEQVREMFSDISGTYDKANDVLTFGMHRGWKEKLIQLSNVKNGNKVLDLASGTGDIAFIFAEHTTPENVTALDFSDQMLVNLKKRDLYNKYPVNVEQGDIMNLRFDDDQFDITSISYGIRNVDDTKKGIQEMYRVTKPGGKILILETGKAEGPVGFFNNIYSRNIMPVLGKMISGDYKAYKYLAETADEFPYGNEFVNLCKESADFKEVKMHKLFFGVSYIYELIP